MSIGEEHYVRVWNRKGTVYPGSGKNLRVETVAHILRSGQRLLDVGCGDGMLGRLVKDRFEEVYGVDISDKAVELARQRGIKAYKVNLNTEELPFEDNYFDAITCLATLQLIYDIIFVLRDYNRVLELISKFGYHTRA